MLPVRWMSPESLADGLFTPMSDIWSYGVLLFEIITFGSFPFQGLSNSQVMGLIKSGNTLAVPPGASQTLLVRPVIVTTKFVIPVILQIRITDQLLEQRFFKTTNSLRYLGTLLLLPATHLPQY